MVSKASGADVFEGLVDPMSDLHIVESQICGTESDVVADTVHEELVVRILEDKAYPPSDLGECFVAQDEPAGYDLTALSAKKPVEMKRQCGLS